MRLVTAVQGRIGWAADGDDMRPEGGVNIPDLIAVLDKAFGFVSLPDPKVTGSALSFIQGTWTSRRSHKINIAELQIFNNGVDVVTQSTTEDADEVLEACLNQLKKIGVREPVSLPVKIYTSTVVIDLDYPADKMIRTFDALSSIITGKMQFGTRLQVESVLMLSDPNSLEPRLRDLNPTCFRIERRVGSGSPANRYYCEANMTTTDLLSVLQEIEQLLA